MTDEPNVVPPLLIDHHCMHPDCTKWGGFGFDRYQGGAKMTDWWCWEHYPYKDLNGLSRGPAHLSWRLPPFYPNRPPDCIDTQQATGLLNP